MAIIHLKLKDRNFIKDKILKENNNICPILKMESDNFVIDHIHRRKKADDITETNGVIRGCIDNGANCLLGVIENNFHRYVTANISLPEMLRNMADYVEKGAYKDEEGNYYSHWTENGGGDLVKAKRILYRISDFQKYEKYCKENNRKVMPYKKYLDTKIIDEFNKCNIEMISLAPKKRNTMNQKITKKEI